MGYCNNCGKEVNEEQAVCLSCGSFVGKKMMSLIMEDLGGDS